MVCITIHKKICRIKNLPKIKFDQGANFIEFGQFPKEYQIPNYEHIAKI